MSKESEVQYIKGANWVSIAGLFTPVELRAIADRIEKDFKDLKK